MRELRGETAVVTGAAIGIGRALAGVLAQRGCALVSADRHAMAPGRVAERIVRGVERGEMRVRVCRETFVADWATRLFPAAVHRLVRRGYRRMASPAGASGA